MSKKNLDFNDVMLTTTTTGYFGITIEKEDGSKLQLSLNSANGPKHFEENPYYDQMFFLEVEDTETEESQHILLSVNELEMFALHAQRIVSQLRGTHVWQNIPEYSPRRIIRENETPEANSESDTDAT
ncbi:hypothetical protein [Paenibacillus humicus]|uniref:hypothetical protein n=1 Tax=Paenibacillus humicus TaxID=412861 RepID=UPI0013E329E8|nr:hypothetical protein [Paenibacillus humicus]